MAVNVLVVDDSGFFRRRIVEILKPITSIQVVGTASNGREAIELVKKLKPDVITMDYEMPMMDGITALREIMRTQPTPVLMFSSLTYEGARVTLDALEAGAVDYLPKNFEDISRDTEKMRELLSQRILAVSRARYRIGRSDSTPQARPAAPAGPPRPPEPRSPELRSSLSRAPASPSTNRSLPFERPSQSSSEIAAKPVAGGRKTSPQKYQLVAIGTSTGGPVALQRVLMGLPASFPAPIVLVQHMPPSFTPAFAERLNKLCKITVRQAENGDVLEPGLALLAPGGKQMMIERTGGQSRIRILPGDNRLNYKPCVDVTFGSAARAHPGKVLGIILTGMGSDGKEGCRMLKETGSIVWSQDEDSSVIYGMPMAVAKAGLSDEVLSLDDFTGRLVEGVI